MKWNKKDGSTAVVLTGILMLFFWGSLWAMRIQGYVTDASGARQGSAVIEFYQPNAQFPIYTTQADQSGYYVFQDISESDYQIRVITQTYLAQWFSFWGNTVFPQYRIRIGVATVYDTLNIIVVPQPRYNPADKSVTFFITDSAGVGLQNQSVYTALIRKEDYYELPGKYIDNNSSVTFDSVQEGRYAILIRAQNYPLQYYAPDRNTLQPKFFYEIGGEKNYQLTIRLFDPVAGDGAFHGFCRSETDQALAGITVDLCRLQPPSDTFRVVYRQTTDQRGKYSFVNIMDADYYIRFSGNGYPEQWYSMERTATTRYPETPVSSMHNLYDTITVRLSLSPVENIEAGKITIFVRDSMEAPVSLQGIISIIDEFTNAIYSPGFDTVSKCFIAENIPTGRYFLKLSFSPYPPQFYSPEGNTAEPIYSFTVTRNDQLYFPVILVMNPGQSPTNTVSTVRGIVQDSVGDIGNAMVKIFSPSFQLIRTAVTDSNGWFVVSFMSPAEIYIGAEAPGYALQYWSPSGMTWAPSDVNKVYLAAGDSMFIDIKLVRFSGNYDTNITHNPIITGIVTGKVYEKEMGLPIRGARIVLSDFLHYTENNIDYRYIWSPWTAYTDSLGKFYISNIPAGTYRCMAEADTLNYVAQFYNRADIPADATILTIGAATSSIELDFSLRKGGIIRGKVVDNNGSPINSVTVNVASVEKRRMFQTATGIDGTYAVTGIPQGNWYIWVFHNKYIPADENVKREYFVNEGSILEAPTIRMEIGGRVCGNYTSDATLSDTFFDKHHIGGSLYLYEDSIAGKDQLVYPMLICPVRFEPSVQDGKSGAFCSDAIKTGAYRAIFVPLPGSDNPNNSPISSSLITGLGYSFVGNASSFASLPKIQVSASDTTGNINLILRKGFSIFGIVTDENNNPFKGNFGVDVFIKQDSIYLCIGKSFPGPEGKFEIPGLFDNEEYYFSLWADGYPSQFWSPEGTTAYPSRPFRFDASSYVPVRITLIRDPIGTIGEVCSRSAPIFLRIEGDSLGFPLVVWDADRSFNFKDYILYSCDRTETVVRIASFSRTDSLSRYMFRDLRAGINYREYVVVGNGDGTVVRSERIAFDPRNSSVSTTSPLWIEVFNGRYGIQIEWGYNKSVSFTERDSVYLYRGLKNETPKLLCRRSAWENRISDNSFSRADSGKAFVYYIEIPTKRLVSPQVSKMLDAAFFSSLARRLVVGPYEKYRRISEAIAAANDFDHIDVKPGTYNENISMAGKTLSINGSWEFGTPPVIDGGGGVAITVPFCGKAAIWYDRPRISGFAIKNSSIGIKSSSAVEVDECLFDNVSVAVSMVIDSSNMINRIMNNPFQPSMIEGNISHCTFIAKKAGSLVTAVTAVGPSEQPGYISRYCGGERFFMLPNLSLSSSVNLILSDIAFYQSNGLQNGLPATVQGNTSHIRVERCNLWKTSKTLQSGNVELAGNITAIDPAFIDSTWWFTGSASPLAGNTWDTRIGYDVRLLYERGGTYQAGKRPSEVRNLSAVVVGLNEIFLRWTPSPAEESIVRYRIYRAPGDPSLYYINQASKWSLKIPEDSILNIVDTFSTASTVFLDTTVKIGTPYLYAVVAIDKDGNDGEVNLPAPPDISEYFVNKPPLRLKVYAGKWHMIGLQGASPFIFNPDSRNILFGWDDIKAPDKTFGQYIREPAMQPCRGYWLKPAADTFLVLSDSSLNALKTVESDIRIRLVRGQTGWNLVSSPFPFNIVPEWLSRFTLWEWNEDSLGYRAAKVIKPWKAYWIYTERDTSLQLWKKQPLSYYQTQPLAKTASISLMWKLQLVLCNGKSWDTDNFIGVGSMLLNRLRKFAVPEPPAAFNAANLYIVDNESSSDGDISSNTRYACLYKKVSSPAERVEWIVGLAACESNSKLVIKDVADLPERLFAFWVQDGVVINLREQAEIEITSHSEDEFGYIVVTADPGDLALYTGNIRINIPFPNPSKGTVNIRYILPYGLAKNGNTSLNRKQHLKLTVHSITGAEVATLADQPQAPGIYHTVWNGTNSSGIRVAAGMYIIRLKYGTSVKTINLFRLQ